MCAKEIISIDSEGGMVFYVIVFTLAMFLSSVLSMSLRLGSSLYCFRSVVY